MMNIIKSFTRLYIWFTKKIRRKEESISRLDYKNKKLRSKYKIKQYIQIIKWNYIWEKTIWIIIFNEYKRVIREKGWVSERFKNIIQ